MAVTDSNTGKSLATPAIGDGPDAAGWDATHKLAFASCGEGVLSVVDASKPGYPTIETLPTQRGARTMAYDSAADRIYLVTAEFGPRPDPPPTIPPPPTIVPGSFTILVSRPLSQTGCPRPRFWDLGAQTAQHAAETSPLVRLSP
jgi:hypothetical protein